MSILETILAAKRDEVAALRARTGEAALDRACRDAPPARSLAAALRRAPGEPVRAIAEIKRASPSAGPIRPGADPAVIAAEYAAAGASAISVLTDERFFDGRLAFLGAARGACALPLLRKDFLIDPIQVLEARAAGADAVLVIVAAVDDARLGELVSASRTAGMDALVEVHTEGEAGRAVRAGAGGADSADLIIGVNHRDLATFAIDTGLTARLRPALPPGVVLVGESGIRSRADVARLGEAGADAVLCGEHLMRAASPGAALRELLGG